MEGEAAGGGEYIGNAFHFAYYAAQDYGAQKLMTGNPTYVRRLLYEIPSSFSADAVFWLLYSMAFYSNDGGKGLKAAFLSWRNESFDARLARLAELIEAEWTW